MKLATKFIHAGAEPDPSTGAIMTPIFQTSTYVQSSPGVHKGFEYARSQNHTRKALEEALKLDWDVAIPGHGNDPMTRADVQAYHKKWAAIASKSLELRKKGVAKEQIRQQIQAELPEIATTARPVASRGERVYLDYIKPTIRWARVIVTISEASRSDLMRLGYVRAGQRCVVIPPGVEQTFLDPISSAEMALRRRTSLGSMPSLVAMASTNRSRTKVVSYRPGAR